jgi:Cdc6-like AAA superfamily ATPase
MINETQKQKIGLKLTEYCARYESQNKAATSLKNVSSGTVSQMLNGKWELIKEEMWRNVATQIGYTEDEWGSVETRDFRILTKILEDSQTNSLVFAVTGEAGTGKSFTMRRFVEQNKNAYLLQCNEFWNRKTFLQELLTVIGRDYSGYTVSEMMHEVVRLLKSRENPVLIFDEFDKVSDQILYFFITLYNQLEDHCGMVLCATDHLAKRIKRGLKLNKKGYKEIFSRHGRRFIELKGLSNSDITMVCMANGIDSRESIRLVIDDSEGDLRRVRRKIHALKITA